MRGISKWSMWTEFTVVIVIAFGYFTLAGLVGLFHPETAGSFTAPDLLGLLVYELFLIAILAVILQARGWTLDMIDMRPTAAGTLQGVGIAVVTHLAFMLTWIILVTAVPQLSPPGQEESAAAVPGIGLGLLFAALLVNSVFEEAFVTGYVITVLKDRYSPWTAINVSVAIRLAYHLYQGAPGVVSIISTGLIFAIWFARKGTLWPLITAHTVLNLYAFLDVPE